MFNYYIISNRYSSCGYKKITTSAQNEITEKIYSEHLEIFIACPISSEDIIINTYPTRSPTLEDKRDLLTLPIFRNLSLEIRLVSGSFPTYKISWGDSTIDVVDSNANKKFPRNNISLVHQFNQLLNKPQVKYQLQISVCNQFSCGERFIPIKVTKCGPPLLKIDHEMEAKVLPRDQKNEILLEWENRFPECATVDWNEYFFEYHISELFIGTESYLDKIQSTIQQDLSLVKFAIPKFTLQVAGKKI